MTDREQLELAAKAAGELHLIPYKEEWLSDPSCEAWNPLRFDGDALRLAVKLQLCIMPCDGAAVIEVPGPCADISEPCAASTRLSATRRAIVRAAAEIGKAMP